MRKLLTHEWRKVCVLFLVVTLPVFLGGCGGGGSLPAFNITGSWFIYHTVAGTPGEQGPDLFTFTQTENALSGTTSQGQAITGTVDGLNVVFSWKGGDGATNTYTGTESANGTTISGTWTSSNGQSGTWNALLSTAPANIAGNWNIFVTTAGTPGEQGPNLFTFTQSGNGISGTTSQGQEIKGTVSSLNILFSWIDSDGVTTNTYTGSVGAHGTMSGTWTNTKGQSGTWRATQII